MSFDMNPADEDPHGECRHHIQAQAAKMRDQQERITFLEKDVEHLREKNNSLQIDLDLANCARRDAIDALEAFQGYDGDEELWAAMKRERDEAVAKLTAIRAKLETIVCTDEIDRGVVLLSSEGTTHKEVIGGKEVSVYDHEHFSPLGDALIELWQMSSGVSVTN